MVWVSPVQLNCGKQRPVDPEVRRAHMAVVRASLAAGEKFGLAWSMQLMRASHYRVVISAEECTAPTIYASSFVDFTVRCKPTVESRRFQPVALGIPGLLGLYSVRRLRRKI